MKLLKWLDDHFEECILVALLVGISCVELLQVVCRNVPWVPSLTWAEELCRFMWIGIVFFSIGYTIRTGTTLRVTALLEVIPWKVQNIANIVIDAIVCVLLGILFYAAIGSFMGVAAAGELSTAMQIPMASLYFLIVLGFGIGIFRSAQMCFIHFKNVNVKPKSSMEEALELELDSVSLDDIHPEDYSSAIGAAIDSQRGDK